MPIKCHCEKAEAISTLNLHLETIRYKLNEKLISIGKSIEEGIKMAKEAIILYLESLKLHDEEIPTEGCYSIS